MGKKVGLLLLALVIRLLAVVGAIAVAVLTAYLIVLAFMFTDDPQPLAGWRWLGVLVYAQCPLFCLLALARLFALRRWAAVAVLLFLILTLTLWTLGDGLRLGGGIVVFTSLPCLLTLLLLFLLAWRPVLRPSF